MLLWSFIFPETYIYYRKCIYLFCFLGKNVHNNYLMGLIFWKCWRVTLMKFKIRIRIWIFQKIFRSNGFQVVIWSQNLRFSYFCLALFLKGFPAKFGGFLQKLRVSYFSFGLIFKRISS